VIELARRLSHLLTQKIERGDRFIAGVIRINVDIVPNAVCRPESVNATRDQKIFRYDPLNKFLRIIEKFARFFTDFWIVENGRETPAQFPGMKEG